MQTIKLFLFLFHPQERTALQSRFRHLESDREALRQSLEDEHEAKAELQRQLSKAAGEAAVWRAK